MTKKDLIFVDQLSVLCEAGTLNTLVALAYLRGDKGKLGTSARDMLRLGIDKFLSELSPSEKARYKEILKTVRETAAIKRAV